MPRPARPTLRRALLLGAACLIATLSCGREVTGPPGTRLMRGFTFDARFDTPGLADGVAGTIVSFTKVRVVLVNALGDTVVDRVIDFPSGADSIAAAFDVPVSTDAPPSGEPMSLALAYINAQNDTVFRGGPLTVPVIPTLPGQPRPAPPQVPVTYVGVGANAATVVVSPPSASVVAGDPFTFTASALDGQGVPIANTPIAWSSLDTLRARIGAPGLGAVTTLPSRGPVPIVAQLLTGPSDTVVLFIQPRAQALQLVSGNNQAATFNAPLAQPLVVRVNATDGLGMPGVTVNFAVTAGGGNVSAPSVVTDANGLAQVNWTAGSGLGAQTVTATATGLAGSPVVFTATAPLTELLHHYAINGDLSDPIAGVNGTAFGGATFANGVLSLDGTSGYAEFASALVPTAGSWSVSLFVRPTLGAGATYLSQGTSGGPGLVLGYAGTALTVGDGVGASGAAPAGGDGLFHHMAMVVDAVANQTRIYQDGVQVAQFASAVIPAAGGTPTRLGRAYGGLGQYLQGDLDEVRVYRGALSAAQVTAINTAGVTAPGRLVFGTQPTQVAVGAAIAPAVVVRAEDAQGRLKTDFNGAVTIALASNPGGATLGGTLTVNAVAGVATFTNLTLNSVATGYTLAATAGGASGATSTPFAVVAGPPASLAFVQQPTNAVPGAILAPAPTVVARDAQGNVATSFTGAVTVAIGANPTNAVLGGTLTVNAVAGVATFATLTLDRAGTGLTLTAAATGLTGATSAAFTIADNSAARLEITQQPVTATAGQPLTPNLLVTARTAGGDVATAFTGAVTVSLLAGDGTIGGNTTINAVAGVATFDFVFARTVNAALTLLVSAPGVTPDTSAGIAVGPGTTYQLIFVQQPTDVVAGAPITPAMTVRAADAFGNTTPTFADPFTLYLQTNPGGATMGGTTVVTPVNGIATFSDITLSAPGNGYRFMAGAPALVSGNSAFFNVLPGSTLNSWIGGSGLWSNAANWSLGRVPLATDSVLIAGSGTYTVTLDGAVTAGVVTVGGGTGTATLDVANQTLTVNTTLRTIAGGVLVTGNGIIAGTGTVENGGQFTSNGGTVQTSLANAGLLLVRGGLNVTGALTTVPGSTIRVQANATFGPVGMNVAAGFTNHGLIDLTSQSGNDAALTVQSGIFVNAADGTLVGAAAAGGNRYFSGALDNQGTITVGTFFPMTLAGTANVNTGTINVNATLNLSMPGGAVLTNDGSVVIGAGQTLALTDGTWQQSAAGTMTGGLVSVVPGATLRLIGGTIASNVANSGIVEATDASAFAGTYSMNTGSVLRIAPRGASAGAAVLTVANGFTNSGTIELTNVLAAARAEEARLVITAGTLANAATGVIRTLPGNGGGDRVITGVVASAGLIDVSPGTAGPLAITGALTTTGTIAVDIGGALPSQYDRLQVTGTATLGGTLNAGLFGGFVPSAGNTFAVVTATTVSGTFGTVNPTPPLQPTPSYTATTVTLTSIAAAVVNSWTSAAGGTWSTAGNWSQGRAPIAGDTVVISLDGTYTVTVDTPPAAVSALFLGGATGTQTLATAANLVTVNGTITVGPNGVLTTAGAQLAGTGPIVNGGTLTLTGATVVAKPVTNNATLVARNTTQLNGSLTTAPGSTIQVLGTNLGAAAVVVANGFVNNGTIEITDSFAASGATLTVTAGTLVNAPGATILSSTGASGSRALNAELDNQGNVQVAQSLFVTVADAQHQNSGTITLTTGNLSFTQSGAAPSFTNLGTVVMGGRSLVINDGAIDLTTGLLQGEGFLQTNGTPTVRFTPAAVQPRITFNAGTVIPDPVVVPAGDSLRLRLGTFAPPSLTIDGTLVLEGGVTVTTAVTSNPGSRIRVRGNAVGSNVNATFTNPLVNAGTIDLVTENAGYTVQLTAPSLTNAGTGVINSLTGSGGTRSLLAEVINQGTINVPFDLTLDRASAAHVNSGTITLTTGDLTVTQSGTAPSFTNTGTIVTGARTFSVSNGLLDLTAGLVSGYGGFLTTSGSPTVRFSTATVQPRVTFSGATVLPDPFVVPAGDSLRVRGGTFAPPSLTNDGQLILEGTLTVTTAFTSGTGSNLRIRGSSIGANPTATFTNPLTNSATIDLTAENAGYSVILVAPSLTNTSTGVINSLGGSGGSRRLQTTLLNQGAVNVPFDLTIDRADAAHLNSGTITLAAADLTVTQSGTAPSFTNTGTIATNGRTLTVAGGTLDLSAGLVSGYTGYLVTTGAPTVRFTTATVQPRVTFSATTVLPDPFVVPAGDSLRVRGGTFSPPSITNNGLLALEGSATIGTTLTTGPGSVLRIRGNSIGANPTATFTTPLTNSSTIDLFAENAGYTVQLVAPSLTNTSTGVINSLVGSGGVRTLVTRVDNQGTINVPFDLTLNAASAAHLNSGTIALTTGDLTITQTGTTPSFTNTGTIATAGRTVTVNGGTLDLSAGLVSGYTGYLVTTGAPTVRFSTATVQPRVTFSATTVLPDPLVVPVGDSLRVRGGTLAPPSLTNNGTLLLEGATTVTTAFTTGPGSLLRIRGNSIGANPTATFTNPLTNSATIDLTAENAGYTVQLVTPSLTNTSTGVVNSVVGSGGVRTLVAQVDNQGTINVPFDLALNAASAAHQNSGTITLTTGDLAITQSGTAPSFTNTGTVATNGRTVTVAGGTLDLSAGLVSGYTGFLVTTGSPTVRFSTATVQPRVTFSATTVLPDPLVVPVGDSLRVRGGTLAPPSLTNNGTLLLEGATTVTTAFTTGPGSLLRIRGNSIGANPTATFTNPLTNSATIDLTTENAGYTVQLVTPSLTNTSTGVINSLAGSGGVRTLVTQVDNQGAINVPFDLALNAASAAHVNSGTITLTTGDLAITQTGTAPSFTNTGTIATNGRTVTVAGGTLDLSAGLLSGYAGFLVTTGTPTVRFSTATVQPRVTFSATTLLPDPLVIPSGDSLRVRGGTLAPPTTTNNGLLVLEGATTVGNAFTTGSGSTLRIRGTSIGGNPTATFTSPLVNSATIDLVTENAGYTVVLTAPSLLNTPSGVINSLTGAGGVRTLATPVTNQGTINVPFDLALNVASAAHANSGTITLTTGDLAITQGGTAPSFTNTGTIATNGRTVTVSGGTLDLSAGLLSGPTGYLVTTGTPTVRFSTATVQPRVTFSATTVLPDPLVIPSGDSLRVRGGTLAPPSLTNDGTLILEGATTVTTAFTTGVGSLLRVRGSSIGGNPTATFTNPLTNSATLDLVAENAGYAVQLSAASLLNTGTGVINSVIGSGGTRTLAAEVNNQGTINVLQDLVLNRASAAHANSGTIALTTGDLSVTQSGTAPSFTNTGTIATNGRTVSVGTGTLDLSAGLVSGYTGLLTTTGATTVLFQPATVQPRVTFSATTTVPVAIVIGATDSLRVRAGTFAATSITNNGAMVVEGTTTITTAYTSGAGSTLLIRGQSAGGNAAATFTNGFTNNGLLRLTAFDAAYASSLSLGAGTLTNAATGSIDFAVSSNGPRTITAGLLDNFGSFTANFTGTIAGPLNQRGTLTVAATRTLTVSGLTTLFSGSTSTATGTLTLTGGCSNLGGATLSGFTCP